MLANLQRCKTCSYLVQRAGLVGTRLFMGPLPHEPPIVLAVGIDNDHNLGSFVLFEEFVDFLWLDGQGLLAS